jgi:hypothetical protein
MDQFLGEIKPTYSMSKTIKDFQTPFLPGIIFANVCMKKKPEVSTMSMRGNI